MLHSNLQNNTCYTISNLIPVVTKNFKGQANGFFGIASMAWFTGWLIELMSLQKRTPCTYTTESTRTLTRIFNGSYSVVVAE